jgi:hypothetical protein
MSILCGLHISIFVDGNHLSSIGHTNSNQERIKQYTDGIQKFFSYNDLLEQYKIHVYIMDNTTESISDLPTQILNVIPQNVRIITSKQNQYGQYNKGSGIMEMWSFNKELILQYDWFIHFEPRQLLFNSDFITNFSNNPRNLFKYGTLQKNHFYTGLFSVKSQLLINFMSSNSPKYLADNHISIEYILFDYLTKNNIEYDNLNVLGLFWFSVFDNQKYIY